MSKAANGLLKLTVYLTPEQYLWLHAVTLAEAVKHGGRPDASKFIREIIDHTRPEIDAALYGKQKKRRK